jgi:methyl-accepting chemotaxis protein
MSLVEEYLDGLRRYSKAVRDMQRALNQFAAGAEEIHKTVEREQKHAEEMATLENQLASQKNQLTELTVSVWLLCTCGDYLETIAFVSNSCGSIYLLR